MVTWQAEAAERHPRKHHLSHKCSEVCEALTGLPRDPMKLSQGPRGEPRVGESLCGEKSVKLNLSLKEEIGLEAYSLNRGTQ